MKDLSRPGHRGLGLLAAMLFVAAAFFYQDPEWNGNSRLDLTRAIVEQGTFRIDAYQSDANWGTEDKAFYGGHFYSDKAIGSSILAVPFYFVLFKVAGVLGVALGSAFVKHVLTTIVLGSAFTVSGMAMYLIARRITADPWRALVPTLGISFGTMLWPYSAVYYGHVIAAALLVLSFYLLFSGRQSGEPISNQRFFWAGLAVSLAFVTEYTAALIIVGLAAYTALVMRGRRAAAWIRAAGSAALGALIPLSILLFYNWTVYGNALAAGYAYEVEEQFSQGMALGVMGIHMPSLTAIYHITLDPKFGLFWQSPILLLGIVGFFFAVRAREYRPEAFLCLYAVGIMIAMNGGYYLWWGGSAFGPRLLIPALPFFIVPLALIPRKLLWVAGVLGLISAANMLIPLMGQVQPTKLAFRVRRDMFYVADSPFVGFSLLYDYGLPQIARQYAAGMPSWTLALAAGLPGWLSVPALVLLEAALMIGFHRRSRRDAADSALRPASDT